MIQANRLSTRRKTREVRIGPCTIGGDRPILVQSMTTTKTADHEATIRQIRALEEAGCEIARVAVFDDEDSRALGRIKSGIAIPLVADIHFTSRYAMEALEQGVDKIRINPGNIGGREKVERVVQRAKERGVPIRIGVNSGSVEKDLLEKYGYPSPAAMVESALRHVAYLESMDFHDIVLSLKATDVRSTIENYRMISERCDYPLHLGVTEAGLPGYGTVKSAVGIGALLMDGIGDTIRVSLTGDPVNEISAAYDILKATGRRITSPEVIACPECGRIQIDLEKIVREVQERVRGMKKPLRISLLGCAVNGPGEAAEADFGLAGGKGEGLIYRKGKIVRKVKEEKMVDALIEEIEKDPSFSVSQS